MATLAEIVRHAGLAYQEQFESQLLPSHRHALNAIQQCRTAALGGHVFHCDTCDRDHYQYHSCRNRHCPQCQHEAGQQWLHRQQARLLNTHYFMLTFTLPDQLRTIARSNQRLLYNLLFRCAAAATQQLASDDRFVGGQIGMVGVLHTWGRNLIYHPHVHFLVPGGGLTKDGQWRATSHNFFVPVRALSRLFRAKLRDALRPTPLFQSVPSTVWQQDWVVHCQPVGMGQHALQYLAPYIFRVAISDRRILNFTDDSVLFRYRKSDTGQWRTCKLAVNEFLRRFLQHVLPKGFVKVRYYGLFSPGKRKQLAHCQQLLPPKEDPEDSIATESAPYAPVCSDCGSPLRLTQKLLPRSWRPP